MQGKTPPLPSAMSVLFLHNATPGTRRPANDRRRRVTHPLGGMLGSLPRGIVRPHPILVVDTVSPFCHDRIAGDGRRREG